MTNIKNIAIRSMKSIAKRFGVVVIPEWQTIEFPLTEHLRALFAKYRIEVVLDVGANKGQYRDLLRNEVGFKGTILSFEPLKNLANLLKEGARNDSAWLVFNCALGSAPGDLTINVAKESTLTSFLPPRKDVAGLWKDDSVSHYEIVPVRTLDDVLSEAKIDCRNEQVYLKLDTQGFDLEVLKGATNSIENIIALQTEASIQPIYEGMPSYRDTLDTLDKLGYEISGIFPVNYDSNLRLIESDCVFINQRVVRVHRPVPPNM